MLKKLSFWFALAAFYIAIKLLVPDDILPQPTLTESEFNADYQMENVALTHFDQNGSQNYHLNADKINFVNTLQKSEFHNPVINIISGDTRTSIHSPIAFSEQMANIYFPFNVEIHSEKIDSNFTSRLLTEKLNADFDRKIISTDAPIEITSKTDFSKSILTGKGLTMDLNKNTMQIKHDLQSHVEMKPSNTDDSPKDENL